MLLFALLPTYASATSGACSYHGGVNCSAGPDYDGSVVCFDGWRGSTVLYSFELNCKPKSTYIPQCAYPGLSDCDTGNARAMLGAGGNLGTPFGDAQLKQCQDQHDQYVAKLTAYNNCMASIQNGTYDDYIQNEYGSSVTSCPTNGYMGADQKCHCNPGFRVDSYGSCTQIPVVNYDALCKQQYGQHFTNYTVNGGNYCKCEQGYFDDGINCATQEQYCTSKYGVGAQPLANSCTCKIGYQFAGSPSICVTSPSVASQEASNATQDTITSSSPSNSLSKNETAPLEAYYIAKTSVNVRLLPNSKSKILTVAKKGEKYLLLEESRDWIKIQTERGMGWTMKRYYKLNK